MTSPIPKDSQTRTSDAERSQLRDAMSLLVKGALLAAAAFAVPLAITVTVPEVNDGAAATALKNQALMRDDTRQIVLVGGSNLAFGIDSSRIHKATGCGVANMGINGYLGVRYMLNEVKPYLKSGDIVVVALEYDSFYKSVDGTANDQLAVIKANPKALNYLTWRQRLMVLKAVPFVAQQKVLRLMRTAFDDARLIFRRQPVPAAPDPIVGIESLAGYNSQGDLISHLGVEWKGEREDGVDMTSGPIDDEVIDLLQSFIGEMDQSGVEVVISFTPVMRDYYDRNRAPINHLYTVMAEKRNMPVPSHPANFVFDKSMMFDTVYHLNTRGRVVRTQKLIADIDRQLGADARCARPLLTQNGVSRPHE